MDILLLIIALYLFFVLGWVLYIAVMGLKRVRDQLHPFARFNAYLVLFVFGYPWDLVMNLLVCLAMGRVPRDWILTGTLQRIRYSEPSGSRREAVASWICEHLLNQFDPTGRHC